MDMQFLEETKMLNYQSADLGGFPNPDKFFEHYTQHWCKMKDFMYVHFGRKIMNYNVGKMRKSHGK